MNVLSLFDGISVGQLALQNAGKKVGTYYASEINKFSINVTQHNFPNTIQLGDVCDWRNWDIDWKLIEGGYDGKTVVMGIRPENVSDDAEDVAASPDTVIESTVRVYELLGAEVYLYFDYADANFTARVKPGTTARTGDTIKLALDATKIHIFDKETEQTITN